MLAFLPIQFSWSAVAAYCEYEGQSAAGHLGHHDPAQHEHGKVDKTGKASGSSEQDQPAAGLDCNHCHGQCSGMPGSFDAVAPEALNGPPAVAGSTAALWLAPEPPDRPQWPRLA